MRQNGRKKRVLVVEDSPADLLMIQKALEKTTSMPEVFVALDGVEALQFLQRGGPYSASKRPDLVLLDLNLPRIGGLEVLEAVAGDPALISIPIIVLTSSEAPEDIETAYSNGCWGYLIKPGTAPCWRALAGAIDTHWFEAGRRPGSRE